MASTLLLQLYSQNHYESDGSQVVYNFTFEDGYIDQTYVKAYYIDESDVTQEITLGPSNFTDTYQITLDAPVAVGLRVVILRDTPKDAPLVNFVDGAKVSETSMDLIARQAVHIAAEVLDGSGQTILTDELGFKALKSTSYTGASTIALLDRGRAHTKTDGTAVTVPDTLPVDFLSTIANLSSSAMTITFASAPDVYLQGTTDDPTPGDVVTLAPWNSLNIWKVTATQWFVSGKASVA